MKTERLLNTDDPQVVAWLENVALPKWVSQRRWFSGESRDAKPRLRFEELGQSDDGLILGLVAEMFTTHAVPPYLIALTAIPSEFASDDAGIIAEVPPELANRQCYLADSSATDIGRAALLRLTLGETTLSWSFGPVRGRVFERRTATHHEPQWHSRSRTIGTEQSNTSVVYGESAILKLLRRPGTPGQPNPDVEIPLALSVTTAEPLTPPVIGVIQAGDDTAGLIIGTLCRYLPDALPGWDMATEAARAAIRDASENPRLTEADARLSRDLAVRTAELHQALSRIPDNEAFAPKPIRPADLQKLGRSLDAWSDGVFERVARAIESGIEPKIAAGLKIVLDQKDRIREVFKKIERIELPDDDAALLFAVRHHGDYHLGQVLWTDENGWQVIDFEGEPKRDLAERRRKAIALRDVAGMARSFDYAQAVACLELGASEAERERAVAWRDRVSSTFVHTYFAMVGDPENEIFSMIPSSYRLRQEILNAFLVEKNLYELVYELDHRPDWVVVPLNALIDFLESSDRQEE